MFTPISPAKRTWWLLAALAVAALLSGCEASSVRPDPPATSLSSPPSAEYVLGTGDKLRITVFGEQNLSGEFQVDAAGSISMPLIGPQRAGGLTPSGLSEGLTRALKNGYLRNPRVAIEGP